MSSLLVGGAEQIALRLAAAQRDAGHAVTILSLRGGPLEAAAARLRLQTLVLGVDGAAARAWACLRVFQQRRFHIVNSHNPHAQKCAVGARLVGAGVVATFHGSTRPARELTAGRAFCDAVVAVSGKVQALFLEHQGGCPTGPVVVIPNGVATGTPARPRAEVRRELGVDGRTVLIHVARLDPVKDHATLLRALARCRERKLALLLVGDGELRADLERLRDELALGEAVRFLGLRQDVPDLLAAADLFVLPSLSEGMPIALLEAMAAGLPVVATAVGGTPEVVVDGVTGRLVPAAAPERLAEALLSLVDDPARAAAMGAAGRDRAVTEYSLAAMSARYLEVYRQVRSALA